MKRISDEAFVVGYIPASGSCVPKRQTFKQPEVMNMLSYLWVLVNRKVKKQEKQVLRLHRDWNVTSESGSCKPLERKHELRLASWYPLTALSGTLHGSVTSAIQKRKPGPLDSSPPNPHFNELLFRHLARPSRIPWKLVLNAISRRHMPKIFNWSIKNTLHPPNPPLYQYLPMRTTVYSAHHPKITQSLLTEQQEQRRLLITNQWVPNTAWGVSDTVIEKNWNLYPFLSALKVRIRGLQL